MPDEVQGKTAEAAGAKPGTKALCLNMIVKNEVANLPRCLASLAGHIACWVIADTGSTDGTQDLIRDFFAAHGIPGELHEFPFETFEQARNEALARARASSLPFDYLLLADADMELIVEDEDFLIRLDAPCYDVLQRSGISYWNPRLLRRGAAARYRGVTHEYLEVAGESRHLHGVWYKDHASGSNRPDKAERDIRLLREALRQDPENARYWFYLAQSYKDAGRTAEAADAYAKRAAMGGWDEEAWYARLQQARCLRDLENEDGFLSQALAAFNQRPHRAEPLYDLARFYRERGMHEVSALFAEAGLARPRPASDVLFVEDFVYQAGLMEEYSIAAYYSSDQARKERGFAACDWLALNREVPPSSRALARHNLGFYIAPAETMMPSLRLRRVGFTPPEGYHAMNPSVARRGDEILMIQRTVNFTLAEDGTYHTPDGAPVNTRNFLLRLGPDLDIESAAEILPPPDLPPPAFGLVLGFEDARLFAWREQLWCVATVRQLARDGRCEQVLARIDESEGRAPRLADWRVLEADVPRQDEKNWMPVVAGESLRFIRLSDPTHIVDHAARTVRESTPAISGESFRGGTQAIEFDGGRLALIHEVLSGEREGERLYRHRFVWFDASGVLRTASRPFFFRNRRTEYAAGLAWHPDRARLMVSFGVEDREAWIATFDPAEVRASLAACKAGISR